MQTILYDGSFEGFLCAVFDVYEYKFQQVKIETAERNEACLFRNVHHVKVDLQHSARVWKGLKNKISATALRNIFKAFLSETKGMEDVLLQYIQYAFRSKLSIESDFSHPAVLAVAQTAKKVHREAHRMEAFVRFQKTKDDMYYAVIDPDHNVLPIIADHFKDRYADQQWLIYDSRRKYGMHYDLQQVNNVTINFSEEVADGNAISSVYDENEEMYQLLWKQYFDSVNIKARKNLKLQLQHMPRRYWKNMVETK